MAHSLSHNIVNGTAPDADEVMDNFNDLLGISNGIFGVGALASAGGTARKTVGTNSSTLASSSQTFSVSVNSVLALNFSGHVAWANDGTGDFSATLQVYVDAAPTVYLSTYSQSLDGSGQAQTEVTPLAGTALVSLSAGSHTISLRAIAAITTSSLGLAGTGVQVTGGSWSGIVIPVIP